MRRNLFIVKIEMDNEELTKQLSNEFIKSIENVIYDDESDKNNYVELNTNRNGPISLDFAWIEGLRTGFRLVWDPSEESIYYSNAISKKHNAIACTCYVKDCKERILIMNDGTAAKGTNTVHHTHGSLYNVYKERYLYIHIYERTMP